MTPSYSLKQYPPNLLFNLAGGINWYISCSLSTHQGLGIIYVGVWRPTSLLTVKTKWKRPSHHSLHTSSHSYQVRPSSLTSHHNVKRSLLGKHEVRQKKVRGWRVEQKKERKVWGKDKRGERESRADWNKLSRMWTGSLIFSHVSVKITHLLAIEK